VSTWSYLLTLGACSEAVRWVAARPDQSVDALWATCSRGDWMAWYLGNLAVDAGKGSPPHRRAVLIACLCARTAPLSAEWSEEIIRALGTIEAWARGESLDIDSARERLWAFRRSASADDVDAAAYAASTAVTASVADSAAGGAAYSAACAWGARKAEHLAALADLIRSAIPEAP